MKKEEPPKKSNNIEEIKKQLLSNMNKANNPSQSKPQPKLIKPASNANNPQKRNKIKI